MFAGRNGIIVAVAVVLGLFVVFLANSYFSGIEKRQQQQVEQLKLQPILVATQPLAFGSVLTPQNTKLVGWPAASVPVGAFRTSMGITNANRGARVALRPIEIGEPILASKISGQDGRATISALLAPGMRAASVRIDDVSGVAGFILPGDVVDVMLTRQVAGDRADRNDQYTDVVLEQVRVIGIDQLADENKTDPVVAKTATLEVDQVGAQKLALASKVGSLTLALRNVASIEDGANRTITQNDLGSGLRSAGNNPSSPALAGLPPGFLPEYQNPQSRARAPSGPPAKPAAPRPSGPTMEIIRGTEATLYEVKRHGY